MIKEILKGIRNTSKEESSKKKKSVLKKVNRRINSVLNNYTLFNNLNIKKKIMSNEFEKTNSLKIILKDNKSKRNSIKKKLKSNITLTNSPISFDNNTNRSSKINNSYSLKRNNRINEISTIKSFRFDEKFTSFENSLNSLKENYFNQNNNLYNYNNNIRDLDKIKNGNENGSIKKKNIY